MDTPSAQGTMHYLNGGRINYEKTISFLKELTKVPVLEELKQTVGYDTLIPWIRKCDSHDTFFKMIRDKYPKLFSYFDYDATVKELTNVLRAAIERKYRSDAIDFHIRDKIRIESKLEGIVDWQINREPGMVCKDKRLYARIINTWFSMCNCHRDSAERA